jgi:tetratricopeptide (TPR) repeat protein
MASYHAFMYQFLILTIGVGALYLARKAAAAGMPTLAPCLSRFNAGVEIASGNSNIPVWANTTPDLMELMSGDTTYCETVSDILKQEIATSSLTQKNYNRASKMPGFGFRLCGHDLKSNGTEMNAIYNGALRQVFISIAALTGDRRLLREAISHELFHAACHAMQLSNKKKSTHSRHAYIDAQSKSQLEKYLKLGAKRLHELTKHPIPETEAMVNMREQLLIAEKNYTYPDIYKRSPDPNFRDPLYRAADNALHIILFDKRVPHYRTDEQLDERLAMLESEVPDIILRNFLPELYGHIMPTPDVHLMAFNTTGMHMDYSCEFSHNTLIAWFNRNYWDLEESQILISLAHDVYENKKSTVYPYAKTALENLIQTGIFSDKKDEWRKAQAYLYLARISYLSGEYKEACTYYERAHKLNAFFNSADGVDYQDSCDRAGRRVQKFK